VAGSILGTSVSRIEDPDLLTGNTTYVDSLKVDGLAHVVFVRSIFAHARIVSIDTREAELFPGVIAVYRAEDLDLPSHHAFFALNDKAIRPPLARGKVQFVGDPIVAIVANTKLEAIDAADLVEVEYEALEPLVDAEDALSEGAETLYDGLDGNLAGGFRDSLGDGALEDADVVFRARLINQRVAVAPMEGNAILSIPSGSVTQLPDGQDLADNRHVVYLSTQMPHGFKAIISKVLSIDPATIRVIAPNVGGAFGGKAGSTAEHSVVVAASMKLKRPLKWVETRSENMVAMPQGRGQVQYVEMGFHKNGKISGLRARIIGDSGAYAGFGGGLPMGSTRAMAQGVYEIPKISYDAAVAVTNTTPVGAFRGAGRPEAAAFLERLMDIAADGLGIDPAEIRRMNFISKDSFPYTTRMGTVYDVGDYELALDKALEMSGYQELRKEQSERLKSGSRKLLGIGISSYVEITAGGSGSEYGSVRIEPDGSATLRVGTSSHGQGHATSFAMIVSEKLGIAIDKIKLVQSDTDLVPRGSGTGGSRSLQIGGSAIAGAADLVLETAKELAAKHLEASVDDIVVSDLGGLQVAGVPTSRIEWTEIYSMSEQGSDSGKSVLDVDFDLSQLSPSFPFGAHVSVVEVDIETGEVRPIRHVAVDDCGRVLNPLIVSGQQHGGIAQGISQVLWEEIRYDESGNPITTNFADYALPSAAEFCSYETANTETPTPLNPLGAKGIGESGTIGAMPAVHNAVIDALSHLGVVHIDMPCTPEKIWRAISSPEENRNGLWREPPSVFERLPVRKLANLAAASEVDV
jgi:carbon-monoxide dehydrogenase large subunit